MEFEPDYEMNQESIVMAEIDEFEKKLKKSNIFDSKTPLVYKKK